MLITHRIARISCEYQIRKVHVCIKCVKLKGVINTVDEITDVIIFHIPV